jgi:CRISPR-associated protein Csd1
MMLQALYAYAEREGIGDVDFEKRKVDYQLVLADDGGFLGLVPLASDKVRAEIDGLPIGPASKNNPGYPSFVVDNAMYVLGTPKDGGDAGKKRENADRCRTSYRDLVGLAAQDSPDEGLCALHAFALNDAEIRRADAALAEVHAKPDKRGDCVLVPLLESDGSLIHARPAVRRWWERRRAAEHAAAAEGALGRCLVTGALGPIARIHPIVKGAPFPGTGAKLVAYDKDPFSSQHLEQGANASVSELAAQRYVAALNHLLEREGDRRRSAVPLDADTVVVFWTREQSRAPKLLLSLFDPVPKAADAADSVEAVWRGIRPITFDPTPFYAVTLSANSTRVVVRDWFETTAAALREDLERWFTDLQLGEGEAEPVPLVLMLRALQATPSAQGDKRGLPPGLATRVFRAAVQGSPLPLSLLAAALQRVRLPPREKEDHRFVLRARVGMIKAVLRRRGRKDIDVALDDNNTDVPYLLGRLFAVLENLQGRALDNPNATIRDRFFGAASSTPALVFPRLLRLSIHHATKIANRWPEPLKARIVDKLPSAPFPAVLDLEQQGLFAIGYYHQREALFRKAPQPEAPAGADAPTTETAS